MFDVSQLGTIPLTNTCCFLYLSHPHTEYSERKISFQRQKQLERRFNHAANLTNFD